MTATGVGRRDGWIVTQSSLAIAAVVEKALYAALTVFVFALPFTDQLPVAGQLPISSVLGSVAGALGVLRLLLIGRVRQISGTHVWMLLFVFWVLMSVLWSIDIVGTITRVGTYAQLLVAAWLIWEVATSETRVVRLLQCYALGAVIAAALVIGNYVRGRAAGSMASAGGGTEWDTDRFTIDGFNANDVGLTIALGIPILFYIAALQRTIVASLLLWLGLFISAAGIVLTGSRGSVLAASASLVIGLVMTLHMASWQKFGTLLAFGAMLAAAVYLVPSASIERLASIGNELGEGTLTHRTVIWSAGLDAFVEHPWLGVGAGAYGAAVLRVIDVPYVAHNAFLSVLVELGVIGALLFGGLLASLASRALRMRALERYLWIALLACWAIGVSALAWEYRKPTWIIFGLLTAHAYAARVPAGVELCTRVNRFAERIPRLQAS